jgi:hypothetical protein
MTEAQLAAIRLHGKQLLRIFPHGVERRPLELCKRLRRLENEAHAIALRLCNGPEFKDEEEVDRQTDRVLARVNQLLGNTGKNALPVFVNRDPRGYALKIESEAARPLAIHKDWGGYGIIAPEINAKGE